MPNRFSLLFDERVVEFLGTFEVSGLIVGNEVAFDGLVVEVVVEVVDEVYRFY